MRKTRFQRIGGVLIDRTRADQTTFIHGTSSADTTSEVLRRLDEEDYRELSILLSNADIGRVRPALRKRAVTASSLDPNLSQGLAMVGGVADSNILRMYIREHRRRVDLAAASEEEQLRLVSASHSLLSIRPSREAARTLVDAIRSGTSWTKQVAAGFASLHLLSGSSLPVERLLLPVLPGLLTADDDCFVSAFPVLLQRHFADASERCKRLLEGATPATRRSLVLALLGIPYYGLELLMFAFKIETQLDIRLSIAATITAAIPSAHLAELIRTALDDPSPAARLTGARLLGSLQPRLAKQLVARRDPDPAVEAVMRPYRRKKSANVRSSLATSGGTPSR